MFIYLGKLHAAGTLPFGAWSPKNLSNCLLPVSVPAWQNGTWKSLDPGIKNSKSIYMSTPYKINSIFFNRIIDHWSWKQLYIHTSSIPPFWNLSGYKAGLLAILIYQPRPQPLESAFQHSGCTVDDSEILHQLRLVVYSHYLQGLYILGGAGVLPSTVFLMNDCNGPGTIHVPCSVNMYVYIYCLFGVYSLGQGLDDDLIREPLTYNSKGYVWNHCANYVLE